ncbi:hypothetical protein MJT46_000172 [Ovis ammon polii x Ovis aries]|nr:hypothetical protein MJT46_000172 [Ovis ammon polii x Ovis aries]
MKIKFREEVYLFSLPIKESEIIVFFLGTSLKDEVLKTARAKAGGLHYRYFIDKEIKSFAKGSMVVTGQKVYDISTYRMLGY